MVLLCEKKQIQVGGFRLVQQLPQNEPVIFLMWLWTPIKGEKKTLYLLQLF